MMEEKKTIRFELLGSFYCKDAETEKESKKAVPGKKALSFLQYLIVNHRRNISAQELVHQFWEDSSDPANALKHMLFKTRSYLRELFPDQENLIVTIPGCYAWNPGVSLELDSERFEEACLTVRKKSGEEYTETLLAAVALYKGDFLAGNDSDWAVAMRRYYQTLFLDVCKLVLPLLQEGERWTEMIGICEQASAVDYGEDIFIVYQMEALIAMGHPERAVETYQVFRKLLWQEFEIEPAEQVERIRMLAESMCESDRNNSDILKLVAEGDIDDQAFFCTFAVFRSIVALEKRHLARSGQDSALVVVSIDNQATPTTDARRLERVLTEGLRTGDPIARLDAGSYILLLAGSSVENAWNAMDRIDRTFHRVYSHSKACITFRVLPVIPDAAAGEKITVDDVRKITG